MLVNDHLSLGIAHRPRYKPGMQEKAESPQSNKAVGRRLRKAREDKGMTQQEAGEAMDFDKDVAQSRVSHYERGRSAVPYEELAKFAEIYGTDPGFLAFDVRKTPTEIEELSRAYNNASSEEKRIIRNILNGKERDRKASKKGRGSSG